jgi:lipoate-protein ligase A
VTAVRGGRLLWHDGDSPLASDAAWNMSVDQAIAESVSRGQLAGGDAVPTLRFYRWKQPTLSLGYFQSHADCLPRFSDVAQVRRATGGGAILHHRELTYSLTLPTPAGQRGARHDLYRLVHQSIINALAEFSVHAHPHRRHPHPLGHGSDDFLCFRRRTDEDLVVSGYKVVGSAQRRDRRSILQHGSILLRASELAPELPGVCDLTSQHVEATKLGHAITLKLTDSMQLDFVESGLTAAEQACAERVVAERFANQKWWLRR